MRPLILIPRVWLFLKASSSCCILDPMPMEMLCSRWELMFGCHLENPHDSPEIITTVSKILNFSTKRDFRKIVIPSFVLDYVRLKLNVLILYRILFGDGQTTRFPHLLKNVFSEMFHFLEISLLIWD